MRKDKIYFIVVEKSDAEEQIREIVQARLAMSWPHTRRKSQRHRVEKSEYLYGREW